MPELPELDVVCEALNRRILGRTIVSVDAIMPGAAIVIRDLTGLGFDVVQRGAQVDHVIWIASCIPSLGSPSGQPATAACDSAPER